MTTGLCFTVDITAAAAAATVGVVVAAAFVVLVAEPNDGLMAD